MHSEESNGCLGSVPGEYIAAAARDLPDAALSLGERKTAEVNAGWFGPVGILFARQQIRHENGSHWAWVAVHAEKITTNS
jgi:hypothetical protein